MYRYAYKYAILDALDGMCIGTDDTTMYILDPTYVPIADDTLNYALKYYYPMPSAPVGSFSDFQGNWYLDAAHTQLWIPA